MEDEQESRMNVTLGAFQKCLKARFILFILGLLLFGINLVFIGAYFYNESQGIDWAVTLTAGVLISSIAFGVLLTKLLERLRMWNVTQVSEFEEFTDDNGELEVNNARSPELELNEQHLPSGILRLKEES